MAVEARPMMKVNLVYCPFVDPVTPPLGIASLKSAIERNSDIVVRCLDANLEWHHRLVAEVRAAHERGQLPAELQRFRAAADLLLDKRDDFFDLERYNRASIEFINFTRTLHLKSLRSLTDAQSAVPRPKGGGFLGHAPQGEPA